MNRLKSFFTTRGFYIALTLGVVAFAVLMGVYEYRENSEKFLGDNSVDLNKSYVEGTPAVESKEELDVTSDAAKNEIGSADSLAGNTDADKSLTSVNKTDSAAANTNKGTSSTDKNSSTNSTATGDSSTDKSESTSSTGTDSVSAAGSDSVTNIINEDGTAWIGYNGDEELVWPLIGNAGTYGDAENATGNVVIPYSMDTTVYFETLGVYKCNPGVMLRGAEGENVYSVYGGTVTTIEETKEFGTVVTVDMGNGYEAKYGQLMNVAVSEGEVIASGENIAEVGPVSSYYTKEGSHLYLAITKDDIPLNPMSMIE